jgi:Na+-translocating ferredoxin:NAD+ oxidoreductase RnfE subunit
VRISHLPRAILALIGGLFITFSQSHAAVVGLAVFALFTLLCSLGMMAIERRQKPKTLLALSTVSLIAAVMSAVAIIQSLGDDSDSARLLFLMLIAGWALVTGSVELYLASKEGFSERSGRDYLISAIFSLALGGLFLIASPDVVSAVGFFGAYLILLGVHWGIASAGDGKK